MFKLELDTNQPAFDAGNGGDPEAEVVRILEAVVAEIRQGATHGVAFDHNGNQVGFWRGLK